MKRLVLLFVVMLGLTACGIGDEENQPTTTATVTPTPAPTPVGTSVNLTPFKGVFLGTSAGSQFSFPTLTGIDSQGRSWSGSLTTIADGATTFEAQNVTERRSLLTLQLSGNTPVSSITTAYFLVADGSPYISISSTGVTFTPTSQIAIPSSAKVGDFGIFGTASGSDGTAVTSTWALNADSNGAAQLVISAAITGLITANEADTYTLDAAGTPTKLAISVTTSGVTINLSGNKN